MQVATQTDMPERIAYYNAKSFVSQIKSGEDYNSLKKTISIVIADFEIIRNSESYTHRFELREHNTGIKFTDVIEINTLELHKLPNHEDGSKKYDWAKFLKSASKEEFEMVSEKNPVIAQAYAQLKVLSQDEENQILYEAREKAIRDENHRLNTAIKQGRTEGESKAKIQIAKQLRAMGMTFEQIAEATLIPIEDLKKELDKD